MIGKNLIDLNLRKKCGITVISIKDEQGNVKIPPDINYRFKSTDVLTLIGDNKQIKRMHFIECF
jgi:K+/H+ antiporter YhaU regulatory subunit KhtT